MPYATPQSVDGLLEREHELALLASLARRAAAGAGQLVVVRGPAGCGKTSLLQAARMELTSARLRALTARGAELERDFAFGVARQLFEAQLIAASSEQRDRLLTGAAALAGRVIGAGGLARDFADDDYAVQHGLYWLTANLAAGQPLLICVDDAHWCDAPSLRWLAYLARRLEGLPVVLALGVRSGEARERDVLDALIETNPATMIEPPALSPSAVGVLLARGLGVTADPDFVRACHWATQGNAFLASELIASLAHDEIAPVSANVADVARASPRTATAGVLRRVARLGAEADALVTAVALLGTGIELRHAALLAELSVEAAAGVADQLAEVAVLARGRPLDFAHPIVRNAVYSSLAPGARARGPLRAARVLAEEDAPVAVVAGHLLHSEPAGDSWVVDVLRDAAAEALSGGAPDVAVTLLIRAAEEPPDRCRRPALLRELGRAQLRAGDRGDAMAGAIAHLSEARAGATDPQLRASAALDLAVALWGAERTEEAVKVLAAEADRLASDDPDLALRVEAHLVATGWLASATSPLVAGRLERFAPIAGRTHAQRLAAGAAAFEALARGMPASHVIDLAQRALTGGPDGEHDEVAPPPWPIVALTCVDRFAAAIEACDAQLAAARARGAIRNVMILVGFRAAIGLRRGTLADAEADARAAFDLAESRGLALDLPATRAFLIEVLLEQGRLDEATRAVADAGHPDDVPAHIAWNWFRHARGRVRLAQGDAAGALADQLACGAWMRRWGGRAPAVIPWRSSAALAHLILGEAEPARDLAEAELAEARAIGAPRAIARALRVSGLTRGGADGAGLLIEAVALLSSLPADARPELELAHALVDAGAAERRAGSRRSARARLTAGMDLAHRCAARSLAERAREELRAAGARPRRPASTGRDALTPSERRVAQRAAGGLTNREIAQELFITPRTVEVHLTHAFSKLGIRSRTHLSTVLDEQDSPDT